ncbi:MAG: hypothetical protein V7698_06970 [Paracoccaceae bacterium]
MTSSDLDREQEIDWNEKMAESHLRNLTANLMRIARGSGKLHEVESQVMELANVLANHRNLTSEGLSPHIYRQAILFDPEIHVEDQDVAERQRARAVVVQGALQFAAAEILNQNTFKSAGDDEMSDGVKMWEAWRKKWVKASAS